MTRSYLVVSVLVVSVLCLSSPSSAQRADRAIISGVVTDSTGSAVAGATVKITDENTGVATILTTNASGSYTTPPLVLGSYSVAVDHSGFKNASSKGILLTGAETVRHDVVLTVGAVTETVEVTAGAETLNVTTPDVTHVVDAKYYQDLPTVTAADVRLAESLLRRRPSVKAWRNGRMAAASACGRVRSIASRSAFRTMA